MKLLFDVVTFGGPSLVHWVAKKLVEEYEHEELDEGSVRGQLLEIQQRYEGGEMDEAEYDRQEAALLERLEQIRALKARRSEQGPS